MQGTESLSSRVQDVAYGWPITVWKFIIGTRGIPNGYIMQGDIGRGVTLTGNTPKFGRPMLGRLLWYHWEIVHPWSRRWFSFWIHEWAPPSISRGHLITRCDITLWPNLSPTRIASPEPKMVFDLCFYCFPWKPVQTFILQLGPPFLWIPLIFYISRTIHFWGNA